MKKKLLGLGLIVILFSSCSVGYKLTGNYPITGQSALVDKSFEEVWSKTIDYFAQNGVPISTIDKSSGLIISSKMGLTNSYSREHNGELLNPKAYVVIPTVRGGFGNVLEPTAAITGSWDMIGDFNVRIKTADSNKTSVSVNLLNLNCFYSAGRSTIKIPISSTGVFEKEMIEYLSK